jgi:hypothetical protein
MKDQWQLTWFNIFIDKRKTTRNVVSSWRLYVYAQRAKHSLRTQGESYARYKVLSLSLGRWKKNFFNLSARKEEKQKAVKLHHTRTKTAAFKLWRDQYQSLRKLYTVEQDVLLRRNRTLLFTTLNFWRVSTRRITDMLREYGIGKFDAQKLPDTTYGT